MTLAELGAFLGAIGKSARHYTTAKRGNFTTWEEYERLPAYADGRNEGGWRIQVERYTSEEYDAIAEALEEAFEEADNIAVRDQLVDKDTDGESLTIRHLFDIEVW